jgi:hypothetical protein
MLSCSCKPVSETYRSTRLGISASITSYSSAILKNTIMKEEESINDTFVSSSEPTHLVDCGRRLHLSHRRLRRQHLSVRTQALKTRIRPRHNLSRLIRGDNADASQNQTHSHRPGNRRPPNTGRRVGVAHILLRLDREDVGLTSRVLVGESQPRPIGRRKVELALLSCPNSGKRRRGCCFCRKRSSCAYVWLETYVYEIRWKQGKEEARGARQGQGAGSQFWRRMTYRTVAGAIVRLFIMV